MGVSNLFRAFPIPHGRILVLLLSSLQMLAPSANADSVERERATDLVGEYEKASFSPTKGEKFTIPINLPDRGRAKNLQVEIFTDDNDLVRVLRLNKVPKEKGHKENEPLRVQWDGKDQDGQIVPDEAYFPVVTVNYKRGAAIKHDARADTGGEEVYDFEKRVGARAVEFDLPENSRLLVRAGISNGPMLRTIVDWEPRAKGFHVERWNGSDSDNIRSIEALPGISYLVLGYKLPDEAIITYGNDDGVTYKDYREKKGWPLEVANFEDKILERSGRMIRPEYYLPVAQLKSPDISIDFLDTQTRESRTQFGLFDEMITTVNIDKDDEYYLDQSRYEISFFVDNEFIAEEEQGFVPFKWRWSPGRYGIEPGEHILTVNVSSYNGQVTVKNVKFVLEE